MYGDTAEGPDYNETRADNYMDIIEAMEKDAEYANKEINRLKRANEWIDIKEMTPPRSGPFLVCYTNPVGESCIRIKECCANSRGELEFRGCKCDRITHWQVLPHAPSECKPERIRWAETENRTGKPWFFQEKKI